MLQLHFSKRHWKYFSYIFNVFTGVKVRILISKIKTYIPNWLNCVAGTVCCIFKNLIRYLGMFQCGNKCMGGWSCFESLMRWLLISESCANATRNQTSIDIMVIILNTASFWFAFAYANSLCFQVYKSPYPYLEAMNARGFHYYLEDFEPYPCLPSNGKRQKKHSIAPWFQSQADAYSLFKVSDICNENSFLQNLRCFGIDWSSMSRTH